MSGSPAGHELVMSIWISERPRLADGTPYFGQLAELAYDPEEDRVQCHLCGRWLRFLGSSHLRRTHGWTLGQSYGVQEHVTGNGRFRTDYTFGAGDPAAHRSFWFQITSLPMGYNPYAPSSSRRLTVRVGGHPRAAAPRRHKERQKG